MKRVCDYTGFWYAVQADGTSFEDSWDNGTYSLEASIALATEIAAEEGDRSFPDPDCNG